MHINDNLELVLVPCYLLSIHSPQINDLPCLYICRKILSAKKKKKGQHYGFKYIKIFLYSHTLKVKKCVLKFSVSQ